MIDKYIIYRSGITDTEIMFVDKDIWDWLDYNNKGKPCPNRLIDSMWTYLKNEHNSKKEMVDYLNTQLPDDRAAYLCELEKSFYLIKDAMDVAKKNNYNIKDEMHLAIY